MNNKHFKRGSGCFICTSCGKQTRDTIGNASCELCALCYVKAECANSLADSGKYTHDQIMADQCWSAFDECTTVEACYKRLSALLGEDV